MTTSSPRPTSRHSGISSIDTPSRNMLRLRLSPPPVSLPSLSDQVPLPTPHPNFAAAVESVGSSRRGMDVPRQQHSNEHSMSPDFTPTQSNWHAAAVTPRAAPTTRSSANDEVISGAPRRSLSLDAPPPPHVHSSSDLSLQCIQLGSSSPNVKAASSNGSSAVPRAVSASLRAAGSRYEPYDRSPRFLNVSPSKPLATLPNGSLSLAILPPSNSGRLPLRASSRSPSRQQQHISQPDSETQHVSTPVVPRLYLPSAEEQAALRRGSPMPSSMALDKPRGRQVEVSGTRAATQLDEPLLTVMMPARMYTTQQHKVTQESYMITFDERRLVPVYEYTVNGSPIMIDASTSYVRFSGIWKAFRSDKIDFSRILISHPHLEPFIKRVKGGSQLAQGQWLPYRFAEELSRRTAWAIRHDLIPLFGPHFPNRCLPPQSPGFGIISLQPAAQLPSGAGTARRARTPLRGRSNSDLQPQQQLKKKVVEKRKSSSLGLNGTVESHSNGVSLNGSTAHEHADTDLTPNDLLGTPLSEDERVLMTEWIQEKRAKERALAGLLELRESRHGVLTPKQRHSSHVPDSPGAPAKPRNTVPAGSGASAHRLEAYPPRASTSTASRLQLPSVLAPSSIAAPTASDANGAQRSSSESFEPVPPPSSEWSSERPGSFAHRSLTWNASRDSLGSLSEAQTDVDMSTEDESPFAYDTSTDSYAPTTSRKEVPCLRALPELEYPRKRCSTLPTFNVTPATAELDRSFDSSVNSHSRPGTQQGRTNNEPALARSAHAWSADEPLQRYEHRALSESPSLLPRRTAAATLDEKDRLVL